MSETPETTIAPAGPPAKRQASKAKVLLRLTELWRIRLDGAGILDVTEYVREQEQTEGSPWKLEAGQKPLSRRTVTGKST